ncbi:phytoene desaturase family protein [Salidesulfovibrio onnuriiensis]|uniref:phytoene desaturase family protein n=1 Tax=Salidesulfovibrio onnuriiensis TaxID=2583823 RepID=UPI0011CCC147|nr:NAD(P)/FAD-dependent oxidoreductase [Salidesulfovibrio onnuriiensis]
MGSYDHVVVGAGISGMTAAILLASQGRSVALVESFRAPAPTVRGFRRRGVHFDTGLHYVGGLGKGQVLDTYFSHLGLSEHITAIPYQADGHDVVHFERDGREYRLPTGYAACREYLASRFPEEAEAIAAYFTGIQKIFDASPFLNFRQPFSMGSFLHEENVTLRDFLDSITRDETLKTLLSYQCLLYGVPPRNALLSTHALVAASYCQSAHSIRGGGAALVRAYEKRLKSLGVDLFCNSEVKSIPLSSQEQIRGVELADGRELKTDSCVWTAQPSAMVAAVPEGVFRPSYRTRLRELEGGASGTVLFGISEAPLPEMEGRSIYLWPGGNFHDMLEGDCTPEDNVIYLSSCRDDESGKTTVTAIFPGTMAPFARWQETSLGKRPEDYAAHKKAFSEELKQSLLHRCPQLRQVEFLECATPLTMRDYCSTPQGSFYGLKHSNDQYNPAPVTKLDGLYLAGQAIVAPGILGAVVSAYLACGIILGHETIHQELRQCA